MLSRNFALLLLLVTASSCSGQKLEKGDLTRRYMSENGFCSTNYYLVDSTYFLREAGCEGRSTVSVGEWKIFGNTILFMKSSRPFSLNDIDLKSFGADYPEARYEEWTKTVDMEYSMRALGKGEARFELVE
jgi:hypothetical protein